MAYVDQAKKARIRSSSQASQAQGLEADYMGTCTTSPLNADERARLVTLFSKYPLSRKESAEQRQLIAKAKENSCNCPGCKFCGW